MQYLAVTAEIDEYRAQAEVEGNRDALARRYSFRDWDALVKFVDEPKEFELAAEAVITGDIDGLREMLRMRPGLVGERSARVTSFDPPVHGATLLHYLAANGVEDYRQKSPPNAVEVAGVLLEAGADPNALASMYGGECIVLPMLVSSSPPARAGVQVPLLELLLDGGADIEGRGRGRWVSPLMTALVFGFRRRRRCWFGAELGWTGWLRWPGSGGWRSRRGCCRELMAMSGSGRWRWRRSSGILWWSGCCWTRGWIRISSIRRECTGMRLRCIRRRWPGMSRWFGCLWRAGLGWM